MKVKNVDKDVAESLASGLRPGQLTTRTRAITRSRASTKKSASRAREKAPAAPNSPAAPASDSGAAWKPNRTTAPVAYVIEAIEERIRSGRLAAGQRLIEADLCAELSVKRGPVREALRILAGDGVLELIAQRGARVRKLSPDDLKDMIPVLGGLVAIAVRLSVGKLRKASVRGELEKYMDQMRYAARNRDIVQFQMAGMRYQDTLQRAANNRFLDYLRSKLHPDLLHRQIPASLLIENWKTYFRHFEQVHNALLSGDEAKALALLYEHERRLEEIYRSGEHPGVWR